MPEAERVGIPFQDFELFCRLLNNLDDFAVAIKYISIAGRPLSRNEFKRAAKVCLKGDSRIGIKRTYTLAGDFLFGFAALGSSFSHCNTLSNMYR